jgi:hypothetical protein
MGDLNIPAPRVQLPIHDDHLNDVFEPFHRADEVSAGSPGTT